MENWLVSLNLGNYQILVVEKIRQVYQVPLI